MSSVGKALELLMLFNDAQPEIGLSQICRLTGKDKATAYRYLQALENSGLVEQTPLTRSYRLGPAVLQLARIREMTVPRKSGAESTLRELADATGETAHVTVLSGMAVFALTSCESHRHSTRVIIDVQTFPLHATASGIAALSFGPEGLLDVAKDTLTVFTPNTATTMKSLRAAIDETRRSGFSRSNGGFESDTRSIAAPLFDQSGLFAGAVSVASVATRFTPESEKMIKTRLAAASRQISRNWGGTVPDELERAWQQSLTPSHELEAAP